MNVLQVCKYYYPITGGMQRIVRDLITGIENVDFRILTSRPYGSGSTDNENGTKIIRVGSIGNIKSTPISPMFPYELHRQLSWADLVHYHLPFPIGPVSHLFNQFDKTPIIATFHDDIIGKGPIVYPYRPVLDRFLQAAQKIIVTSSNMRENCSQISKFKKKTQIVPIGINMDGASLDQRMLSNRHLLFVGRLVEFKGVKYLISAMKKLSASLSIVGRGPERTSLEQHAVNEGVSDKVTFEGYVSEERLDKLYNEAGIFVLPSVGNNESFGIVQLEAMKHGLPVINTALPTGVPNVSIDGITGITVEPGKPEALASATTTLFENPDMYQLYSKNAQQRVLSEFKKEHMLDKTEDLYQMAVG